jgi:PH domain
MKIVLCVELTPHKSIDITGCLIFEVKPNKVADVDYFPFVISNQKSSKVYNLAASTKQDSDDWIMKIREASSKQTSTWNSQGYIFTILI